ncbi:MAG TPA: aminotransferase class I/II-fold pyridoxal phosphate-dependent enzyme [Acidimicrobiales bacterium]|jgi:histidinol-phosphate/aromatic aminotransferase/cobyric acid decarboxylase-like protein|nr:aminotransferase class I/II-fold pyridoxal phosphate-dependent enzyme [Acidimicrobiales bacterium]
MTPDRTSPDRTSPDLHPVIPPPGIHGGDGAALAAALGIDPGQVLDLSASLNPVAPDVAEITARHLDALARYPDPATATGAFAQALGVEPDRVLLTNGGAEAIALVRAEVGGGAAEEPEFGLHPRSPEGPRWRSNPNNPLGLLARPDQQADVWDEAYYPLSAGEWTAGRPGIVVGSLTKLLTCPGLRIGYVLADPDVIVRLQTRQPDWSLNGLAAESLPDLLDAVDLPGWSSEIARLRGLLTGLLDKHGLDPRPSDANFVLCANGHGLRTRLARHAVLVRDCTSYGLPGHARLAVPDEVGLARLEEALCAGG